MEAGNILGTLLPNLATNETMGKVQRRTLSQVERDMMKGSSEVKRSDGQSNKGENGQKNSRKKRRSRKKGLAPQNNNKECAEPSVTEGKVSENHNNKETLGEEKLQPTKAIHVKEKKEEKGKNANQNGQPDQKNNSTSSPEEKKTKSQHNKRRRKKDRASCPPVCKNCGKSPTSDPAAAKEIHDLSNEAHELAKEATRPRDSPSRYNFRKLDPSSPMLSENADKEGYLTPNTKIVDLKDMTAYALMQSPLQNAKIKAKGIEDLAKNSPLASGNLTQAARELPPVNKDFDNSPPSSSSTMSSTNIHHILTDEIQDSPTKKLVVDANEKVISREIRSDIKDFAPVDVTKNGSYIFCVSQATHRVEVFGTDGKKVGKLSLPDKRNFVVPRNVLHVPHCQWVEGSNGEPVALKAGCIVVLDSNGLHIFSENGQHLGCVLEGSGHKYRGLGVYKALHLVTIDVSCDDGVYLVMIDLANAVKNQELGEHKRIRLTELTDKLVKCRFVTTTFRVNNREENIYAYVTAMLTKDVFKINLDTEVVEKMRLFAEEKSSSVEATFVQDKTINMIESEMKIYEPTGITVAIKTGNILIADRVKNKIEVFAPSGLHLESLIGEAASSSKSFNINSPIGIYLSPLDGQLYIASNANKVIVTYDFNDYESRSLK